MLFMLDVVFAHTSPDNLVAQEHPEWFHRGPDGRPAPIVEEWWDVVSFDWSVPVPAMWDYLVGVLQRWADLGVDGFRCDVAAAVPVEFWHQAKAAIAKIKPDFTWLGESSRADEVEERRAAGIPYQTDADLFCAFDLLYDYDFYALWTRCVTGDAPLWRYYEMMRLQGTVVPARRHKLRFVENHDKLRICSLCPLSQAKAWTAATAFLVGSMMIYAGEESTDPAVRAHWPSLFDSDPILPSAPPQQPEEKTEQHDFPRYVQQVCALKKHEAFAAGRLSVACTSPAVVAVQHPSCPSKPQRRRSLVGVFNVAGTKPGEEFELPAHLVPISAVTSTVLAECGGDGGGSEQWLHSVGDPPAWYCRVPQSAVVLECELSTVPQWFESPLF
eukprot:TRINITY_DN4155_c0_g1_i1.p1 TRINITY_DN4155_c0_g1~~TRINITY_DN4155_c0_g1_i1.p1  ORF type:complete len:386 (+),score=87.50 TRINITY_DN4155_c0_g1_i1:317-1474(+)